MSSTAPFLEYLQAVWCIGTPIAVMALVAVIVAKWRVNLWYVALGVVFLTMMLLSLLISLERTDPLDYPEGGGSAGYFCFGVAAFFASCGFFGLGFRWRSLGQEPLFPVRTLTARTGPILLCAGLAVSLLLSALTTHILLGEAILYLSGRGHHASGLPPEGIITNTPEMIGVVIAAVALLALDYQLLRLLMRRAQG